jgi:hypothetical protein
MTTIMLGYSTKDVFDMQNAIELAIPYIPANSSNDSVREGLLSAFSLLEGLVVEGHIQ